MLKKNTHTDIIKVVGKMIRESGYNYVTFANKFNLKAETIRNRMSNIGMSNPSIKIVLEFLNLLGKNTIIFLTKKNDERFKKITTLADKIQNDDPKARTKAEQIKKIVDDLITKNKFYIAKPKDKKKG